MLHSCQTRWAQQPRLLFFFEGVETKNTEISPSRSSILQVTYAKNLILSSAMTDVDDLVFSDSSSAHFRNMHNVRRADCRTSTLGIKPHRIQP